MLKTFPLIKTFLVVLCVLLFAQEAFAQTLAGRTSPRTMEGVRPLGMGGAFIATDGVDENAIFYNPAAINDFEDKIHMQFVLPTVEFSYKAIPFVVDDILGLADDIDAAATNSDKIDVFDAFTAANTGRYEEFGVRGNLVNFMYKWVSASLFYQNQTVVSLTNPASTTIDIEALTQIGLQVGTAYSFFDDHLQAGIAVKFVERHLIDETVTQRAVIATNSFDDILDYERFGFGVGVDLGVKGTLPIDANWWNTLDPVFALTLQDVAHTRFSGGVGRQRQSLTFGFALRPEIWKFKTNFVVDVRDLEYQSDIINKLHAGVEFTLPDISKVLRSVSLRAGMNQGYWSLGFGLDFKYAKLNVATWGREVAARSMYQKQSRMFGFQLAAGF